MVVRLDVYVYEVPRVVSDWLVWDFMAVGLAQSKNKSPAKSPQWPDFVKPLIEAGGKKNRSVMNGAIMNSEFQVPSKNLKYQLQLPFVGNAVGVLNTGSEAFPGITRIVG